MGRASVMRACYRPVLGVSRLKRGKKAQLETVEQFSQLHWKARLSKGCFGQRTADTGTFNTAELPHCTASGLSP